MKLSRKAGDPPFNEKDEQILEVCNSYIVARFIICVYFACDYIKLLYLKAFQTSPKSLIVFASDFAPKFSN